MEKFPLNLTQKLEDRQQKNMLRQLTVNTAIIDFSSNDYLGFSNAPEISSKTTEILKEVKLDVHGATGSRLISGNHMLYQLAEDAIAAFHKAEGALIFNSGYDANVGLFSSVPQKRDVVLYDEYIHASIRDGIRLSYASAYKFKHNNTAELEELIARHRDKANEVYIAVESVFSMDGDSAPLPEMVTLCEKYGCRLIVDEAHALGVLGEQGEGLVQHLNLEDKVFARLVTFGKGLGCHGAAVLGSRELVQYLVNFARSFIYTTALPPHSVATILAAYLHLQDKGQEQQKKLDNIVSFFKSQIYSNTLPYTFIDSASAIHCAVVPGNENVKNISSVLQREGLNVKPILSPTVLEGSERLRICLHSYNTEKEVLRLFNALQTAHR